MRSKACDELAARGHLGRADRPADGLAAGYRDDRALGGQDRPAADRGRGVRPVRHRRGDRGPARRPRASTTSTRRSAGSTAPSTPTPYSPPLEAAVVPNADGRSRRPSATWRPSESPAPETAMPIEITIPRLGWNMDEGVFVGWLKQRRRAREGRRAALQPRERQGGAGHREPRFRPPARSHQAAPARARQWPSATVIGFLLHAHETETTPVKPGKAAEPSHRPPLAEGSRLQSAARRWRPPRWSGHIRSSTLLDRPQSRRGATARAMGIDWTTLREPDGAGGSANATCWPRRTLQGPHQCLLPSTAGRRVPRGSDRRRPAE